MIHPAFENSLSEGVLVAGTQRRFRAISAIAGKRLQFCLHHCSMLASTDGDGSCMYLCISCSALSLIDIRFFVAGIVNMSPRSIPNPVFAFFEGGSRSSFSLSEWHRWAPAAPLHVQPCHMWSSTECPLLESAYVLAFQVLLASFGGCAQPVMTCERMSPVESSEPQLFLLGVALVLLSHTS